MPIDPGAECDEHDCAARCDAPVPPMTLEPLSTPP
eukprot:COSAG02_NODE_59429_length_274_cov_0.805714_1_plen_34_part_01